MLTDKYCVLKPVLSVVCSECNTPGFWWVLYVLIGVGLVWFFVFCSFVGFFFGFFGGWLVGF